MSVELRAHASIQQKANCPIIARTYSYGVNCPRTYYSGVSCPRTSYSGVNCPQEESWGRDSLLQIGTAYSEVTCPRGTGYSGVKCPRTTYSGVNGPVRHFTPWTVSSMTGPLTLSGDNLHRSKMSGRIIYSDRHFPP